MQMLYSGTKECGSSGILGMLSLSPGLFDTFITRAELSML